MQIVIDIPEEEYNRAIKRKEKFERDLTRHERLLVDGTPLPKGHGDLIDKNNIKEITVEDSLHRLTWNKGSEVDFYIDAPTIIEADKDGDSE